MSMIYNTIKEDKKTLMFWIIGYWQPWKMFREFVDDSKVYQAPWAVNFFPVIPNPKTKQPMVSEENTHPPSPLILLQSERGKLPFSRAALLGNSIVVLLDYALESDNHLLGYICCLMHSLKLLLSPR